MDKTIKEGIGEERRSLDEMDADKRWEKRRKAAGEVCVCLCVGGGVMTLAWFHTQLRDDKYHG